MNKENLFIKSAINFAKRSEMLTATILLVFLPLEILVGAENETTLPTTTLDTTTALDAPELASTSATTISLPTAKTTPKPKIGDPVSKIL